MSIKTLFQDIATAIKTKDSSIQTITPSQMPNAILNISGGGDAVLYLGTDEPSSALGSNGDYYYRYYTDSVLGARGNKQGYIPFPHIKDVDIYGFKFTAGYSAYTGGWYEYLCGCGSDNFVIDRGFNVNTVEGFARGNRWNSNGWLPSNPLYWTLEAKNGIITLDDDVVKTDLTTDAYGTTNTQFALYASGSGERKTDVDIFEIILYGSNGAEILNAHPVIVNGTLCFYDSISDEHYYINSGSLTQVIGGTYINKLYKKVNNLWEVVLE